MIGAADTFCCNRSIGDMATRVGVELVKQEMGSDPASVSYDTLESAINKEIDVVLN